MLLTDFLSFDDCLLRNGDGDFDLLHVLHVLHGRIVGLLGLVFKHLVLLNSFFMTDLILFFPSDGDWGAGMHVHPGLRAG